MNTKTPEASPSKQYYEAVTASELPERNGDYTVKTIYGEIKEIQYNAGSSDSRWKAIVAHWLRPIDLTLHDREVADKAWEAGQKRLKHEFPDVERNAFDWILDEKNAPKKEEYLNSIK